MGEEVAGQDEERDRHDLEALDAGEELKRDRLDRHLSQKEQIAEHRKAERNRDRHAGQHQHDQQAEDQGAVHRVAPPVAGAFSSTPSTWPASWCGTSPDQQKVQATSKNRKQLKSI